MKISKKRIIITGGTSGIGYEIVKQLYADNEIIVISRDKTKLDMLAKEFGVIAYQADLSKLGDVEVVADKLVKQFETVDVLINNAAIQYTPKFLDDDFRYESISYEIALNFTNICNLTYLLLPILLQDEKAVIMNVNSGLGLAPKTTSVIYCATKGGLNIFSQSLRYQLEQTNIRVLQAFLDIVDTQMTKGRGSKKMTSDAAAQQIIYGIENNILDHDINRVKFLRLMLRIVPSIAKKIMKKH